MCPSLACHTNIPIRCVYAFAIRRSSFQSIRCRISSTNISNNIDIRITCAWKYVQESDCKTANEREGDIRSDRVWVWVRLLLHSNQHMCEYIWPHSLFLFFSLSFLVRILIRAWVCTVLSFCRPLFPSSYEWRNRGKRHKHIDMCGQIKCKIHINANNECVCIGYVISEFVSDIITVGGAGVLLICLSMCAMLSFPWFAFILRSLFYACIYFMITFRYFNHHLLMLKKSFAHRAFITVCIHHTYHNIA